MLNFEYKGKQVLITWGNQKPEIQQLKVDINNLSFYSRVSKNENLNKTNTSKDITKERNKHEKNNLYHFIFNIFRFVFESGQSYKN